MNAATSSAAAEKSLPVDLDVEAEISALVEQNIPKHPPQIETEVERIRSSLERLTSNSIEGLQGLTSELQELQRFLNAEVQRVQGEIESALAGIKIIIETIAPWNWPGIGSASDERPALFGQVSDPDACGSTCGCLACKLVHTRRAPASFCSLASEPAFLWRRGCGSSHRHRNSVCCGERSFGSPVVARAREDRSSISSFVLGSP
jgi:hypothetical protein